MLSNKLDRISFWSLFVVVVLLPVFFLPYSKIPVETSKGLLLIVGLAVSLISWAAARFTDGKIILPKSKIIIAGLIIVGAFLFSALLSSTMKVSLFGTMFDMGTFWFILGSFILMLMSAVTFRDAKKSKKILFGLIISSIVVFVFQIVHLFIPKLSSLGILIGKMDNLVGPWSSIAVFAGLVSIISIFSLEFFSLTKERKIILSILTALSILWIALVNFGMVWTILGIFTLFIFIYKVSFYMVKQEENKQKKFPLASFIVIMISLLFFISGQFIGGFLPSKFGVVNNEIRPSFTATMSVAKNTLMKDPVFGSGPNKFSEMWNMYKPETINNTVFWNTSFSESSGNIPTFIITTGALGTIAWLLFLVAILFAGFKLLMVMHKDNRSNMKMVLFYIMSLYLFVTSIFYPIGSALFLLAFAFIGIFVGLSIEGKGKEEIEFSFLEDARKSFFAIIALVAIIMISVSIVFKYMERFISIPYFQKSIEATTIESAESNINKAVALYQNDLYLRTYSQVYLLKTNSLISKISNKENPTEQEKTELQANFDQAIKSAQLAVDYNKSNYLNHEELGSIYEAGVAFGAKDAYDKAVESYKNAISLNPLSPALKFDLARLSFANGKTKEAKDYANQVLSLRRDYIDALIILSQIAKSEGETSDAISYANQALAFYPDSKELKQYADSLRGFGQVVAPSVSNDNNKVPLKNEKNKLNN